MPVVTRDLRASAAGVAQFTQTFFPDPNGTLDEVGDRRFLGKAYAFTFLIPPPVGFNNIRASIIQFDQPWMPMYPAPDGSISVADRRMLAGKYFSDLPGPPLPPSGGGVYIPVYRPRRR